MTLGSNPPYKGLDRAFCVRMKSTLTKRGCHFKSSGYRVSKKFIFTKNITVCILKINSEELLNIFFLNDTEGARICFLLNSQTRLKDILLNTNLKLRINIKEYDEAESSQIREPLVLFGKLTRLKMTEKIEKWELNHRKYFYNLCQDNKRGKD